MSLTDGRELERKRVEKCDTYLLSTGVVRFDTSRLHDAAVSKDSVCTKKKEHTIE